ncbi:MAG: sigma-70 family RNA polymerase sigma factor [Beijerinckiaceae bacterium]|nr:sigma-70 family RNA polymerase sigma factor [Beijerinckiaceae bacterium]
MTDTDFKRQLIAEIPSLRAFAVSVCGSFHLADDLVQETLMKAWANSTKFEMGTSMRAWLFTILRNGYYSLYRKRHREVQDSDGYYAASVSVQGAQESRLDLADLRKALDKLPVEQREVLILVGPSGLSYEEAAEICNVQIGTIKSRVNRGRTKLAQLMGLDSPQELLIPSQILKTDVAAA